jgi:hypothetical protein
VIPAASRYAFGMQKTEFQGGREFQLPISFEKDLTPEESVYVELVGPQEAYDQVTLRNIRTTRLGSGRYLLDGHIPKDTPCGPYRVVKLELHRRSGEPKTQTLAIPPDGAGFEVIPWRPVEPPPAPKVTSLG